MSEKSNPMRKIGVYKVVVNIGVGEAGERLVKAEKVLQMLTGHKPVRTQSRMTNRDFNIRKHMPIGVKVTLRGKDATDFVKRALWTKEYRLADYSFDPEGNFSFGIKDHTTFEGVKYDPEIGVFGMDISVVLKRKGYRIAERKKERKKLPAKQRISREEGIEFAEKEFNAVIIREVS